MVKIDFTFKLKIFDHCKSLLEDRIVNATKAMTEAQDSANEEDKSSAGDKYETARAMGHLNRDMNARQLALAREELNSLLKTNIQVQSGEEITQGSMVETDQGFYFICAGIGITEIGDQKVVVLSPKSPFGIQLLGKKMGERFVFNGKTFVIRSIH